MSNTMEYFTPAYMNHGSRDNSWSHFLRKWGALLFSILSFLSLIVILILNLTTLVKNYSGTNQDKDCKDFYFKMLTKMHTVTQDISLEIKPKLKIISSSTSYTIPSMINSAETSIANDIIRTCNPAANGNITNCPHAQRLFHSGNIALLNRLYIDQCYKDGGRLKFPEKVVYESYPSFIPPATTPGGCATMPSLSLSNTIFSYTQTVDVQGCIPTTKSFQTWILGYVDNSPYNTPEPKVSRVWDMGNRVPRKGCTTVALTDSAWMGCTVKYWNDQMDYTVAGINQIFIAYQDVYGNQREWTLRDNQISFDHSYRSISFAVGSGIHLNGEIIFLMYGILDTNIPGDVYCQPEQCDNVTQQMCNQATFNNQTKGKQFVNALMVFQDNPNARPSPSVYTLPPSSNWQGSEGRLMYDESTGKLYIYTKSSGWHSSLQIGELKYGRPWNISWVPYVSVSRPGKSPCNNSSRCPNMCLTGVYNDFFPLTSDLSNVIGVSLMHDTIMMDPYLIIATPKEVKSSSRIYPYPQYARYTTTTCFSYQIDIWCLSIVEIEFPPSGDFLPIPFVYKLEAECSNSTWWSRIVNNQYVKKRGDESHQGFYFDDPFTPKPPRLR
nr:MAG: attachment glycoprotein [Jingmen bat jeilongvirus 7]